MKKDYYRIGLVKFMDHASLNRIEAGIRKALKDIGDANGITLDCEGLVFDGKADTELMKEIGHKMVDAKADLVISIATPPTVAMKDILAEAEIPMLFRAVSDPVSAGVIDSYEKPGKWITGTSDALDGGRLAEVMLSAIPDGKKFGILYNTAEFSSKMPVLEAKQYLDSVGKEWVEAVAEDGDAVMVAAKSLIARGVDAVLTPTDNTIMGRELEISPVFTEAGIPQFTGSHAFTINGAFMGMGSLYTDGDRETSEYIVKLIVDEMSPMDVPVIRSPHTFAAINNQICEQLGYDKELLKERFAKIGMDTMFLDSQKEFDPDSEL